MDVSLSELQELVMDREARLSERGRVWSGRGWEGAETSAPLSPAPRPRAHARTHALPVNSLLPLETNACLPGCVWNATPRSLSPLERNIGFWTQA